MRMASTAIQQQYTRRYFQPMACVPADQQVSMKDGAEGSWLWVGLTDGVDVGSEELSGLAPELEDGDTAGTLGVGEDLNQVGCTSVVSVSKFAAR
jgi:hypothetical protein